MCDSIKRHHLISFNNFKYRLIQNYHKKLKGLITKTSNEKINKIKKIQYSYHVTNNKYFLNTKFDPSSDIQMCANDINIIIDPKKFTTKEKNFVEHTNSKWFINLSNTTIPQKVSTFNSAIDFAFRFNLTKNLLYMNSLRTLKAIWQLTKLTTNS